MADYTTNLNLEKPAGNENFRRQVLNENMDKIDAAVAARETITGAQAKADAVQTNLNSHLADSAAHGLGNGIQNSTTLSFGYNRVQHTGPVAVLPEIEFTGRHYVNALGKAGDCESAVGWMTLPYTVIISNTQKVFGQNSFKCTPNSGDVAYVKMNLNYTISTSKYYMASMYVFYESYSGSGNVVIALADYNDATVTGRYAVGSNITKIGQWQRIVVKVPNNNTFTTQNGVLLYCGYPGAATGTVAYIDGIMFNEISASDYTLSDTELMAKYPYIEGVGFLTNPCFENRRYNLVRNGNGEEGIGYWIGENNGVLSIVNGKLRLTGTGGTSRVFQRCKVELGKSYYIKAGVTNGSTTGYIQVWSKDRATALITVEGTFNSGSNDEVIVLLRTTSAGYADFDSIILIEGTTAPTEYKSCDYKAFVPEGQFFDGDQIKIKDGAVSGLMWWKHRTLFGKDYDWEYVGDNAGFKRIKLGNITIPISIILSGIITAVELTDDYLPHILVSPTGQIIRFGNADTTIDKFYVWTGNGLCISISDTYTGWSESVAPNNDEIKAFMNGWKAVTKDGSRYVAWISVIDGSTPFGTINTTASDTNNAGQAVLNVTSAAGLANGDRIAVEHNDDTWSNYAISSINVNAITLTGNLLSAVGPGKRVFKCDSLSVTTLLNWCKNNVSPGYEGYRLHYKLANPEPVTDINVPIRGDPWSLVPGDNFVNIDSGIVLGEVIQPKPNSNNSVFYINQITADTKYSPFRNKVEICNAVNKNGINNIHSWIAVYDDGYGYGRFRATISQTNYDPNATYSADYQILKTLHAQVFSSLTMRFAQDVFSAVTSANKALEEKQQKDSALDTLIDLSKYEDIDVGSYYPSWTKTGSTLNILIDIPYKVVKNAVPVIEIVRLSVWSNQVDITGKFNHASVSPKVRKDRMQFNLYTTDSGLMASIPANGVYVSVSVKVGRI